MNKWNKFFIHSFTAKQFFHWSLATQWNIRVKHWPLSHYLKPHLNEVITAATIIEMSCPIGIIKWPKVVGLIIVCMSLSKSPQCEQRLSPLKQVFVLFIYLLGHLKTFSRPPFVYQPGQVVFAQFARITKTYLLLSRNKRLSIFLTVASK